MKSICLFDIDIKMIFVINIFKQFVVLL